jgi:hypothetical protein
MSAICTRNSCVFLDEYGCFEIQYVLPCIIPEYRSGALYEAKAIRSIIVYSSSLCAYI